MLIFVIQFTSINNKIKNTGDGKNEDFVYNP